MVGIMEQLLLKLAKQLDAIDEASLMALWDEYANKVNHFEPTQRWEEATLIFSLIQAKRWKNQLFNYQWSSQLRPQDSATPQTANFTLEKPAMKDAKAAPKKAAQLAFVLREEGNTKNT